MKLTYLGTAAAEGWPGTFCNCTACRSARALGGKDIRTRSHAIVDGELLLDLPCDTYFHILRGSLDLSAVRWLLVTHSHTDHFYPSELIFRGGCYAYGLKSPKLEVFCNNAVRDCFYRTAGNELLPEVAQTLCFHTLQPFESFEAGPYIITPLPARHMKTEQAFFYLIEREGRSILYAHDTGRFFTEVYDFLERRHTAVSLISLDCTSGPLENGEEGGHMGIPDAICVKQHLLDIGAANTHTRFVLNHFSHNGGLLYAELSLLAAREGMEVSWDGLEVTV